MVGWSQVQWNSRDPIFGFGWANYSVGPVTAPWNECDDERGGVEHNVLIMNLGAALQDVRVTNDEGSHFLWW
jgi:hypothetical protein